MGHLLNNAFPLEDPPIGLKGPLNSLIMMPTIAGTTIAEEVQRACEEEIGGHVEVEPNKDPLETKHPLVDPSPKHPIKVELDNVDNRATLQEACIPMYQGAQCNKIATTMTLVNMCTIHRCSNKFVDESFCYSINSYYLKTIVNLVTCMVQNLCANELAWITTK